MKTSVKGVEPEWYDLTDDGGDGRPAGFFIRPLNGMAMAEIVGDYLKIGRDGQQTIGARGITEAFRMGVTNWRNIEDADQPGSDLLFSRDNMGRLDWAVIMEVGAKVLELSQLREPDRKNLSSPSSSPVNQAASPALSVDAVAPKVGGGTPG